MLPIYSLYDLGQGFLFVLTSLLQFSHFQNGNNNSEPLTMLSLILNESIYVSGDSVTESGVWLLATVKPIKRQCWWKGKLALFWRPANRG